MTAQSSKRKKSAELKIVSSELEQLLHERLLHVGEYQLGELWAVEEVQQHQAQLFHPQVRLRLLQAAKRREARTARL